MLGAPAACPHEQPHDACLRGALREPFDRAVGAVLGRQRSVGADFGAGVMLEQEFSLRAGSFAGEVSAPDENGEDEGADS